MTNPTVIDRLVKYSILIRNIKLTLLQLRKSMILIRGLIVTVPSYKDLVNVELELINRLNEVQNSCRLLITPLYKGIDFGNNYINHWGISMSDIRQGYCELEQVLKYDKNGKPYIFGKKYILLLRDYNDGALGLFHAGELIDWITASHFVENIPIDKIKSKGLYDAIVSSITLATNYRTSQKLFKDE